MTDESPAITLDETASEAAVPCRETVALDPEGTRTITVLRFGTPGARPKVYLQAGLHADELPGMLVLRELAARLEAEAARGAITGEIVVVPIANPIGLAQRHGSYLRGRHHDATGSNFNRDYPALTAAVSGAVAERLGPDPAENVATIRQAMAEALAALAPATEVDRLRHALLGLAFDADIVLDLHADNQALVHLYTGNPLWPDAADLAAEIDARAVLLCDKSGGNPFDEACSAPWWEIAAARPDVPVPPACLAATLELRSSNDVDPRFVADDAAALLRFLEHRGVVAGAPRALPRLLCEATPLDAMQQLASPAEGVVVYHARLGDMLRAGDLVAEVIDPLGAATELRAETDGLLFARHDQPYAWPGKIIGKIAGNVPLPERKGHLLSD